MNITKKHHGNFRNKDVSIYTLSNDNNMTVTISELGGIIVSLIVPDDKGETKDVVLGYDDFNQYATQPNPFFGAIVGRVANRIRGASYTINGKTYKLDANENGNTLHGGTNSYSMRVWDTKSTDTTKDSTSLVLSLLDPDGEQGFGGNVNVTATYTLSNDNTLKLEMIATTDQETPISFTAHSYFNLNGHDSSEDTSKHTLQVNAEKRLDKNDDSIPNGDISSILNTNLDFTKPQSLERSYKEIQAIDVSYIIPKEEKDASKVVEVATISGYGRTMSVSTNEKTIHFYNGCGLSNQKGKNGAVYNACAGLCLEPKGYVNSVNIDHFPSDILKPGEEYNHTIIYAFS